MNDLLSPAYVVGLVVVVLVVLGFGLPVLLPRLFEYQRLRRQLDDEPATEAPDIDVKGVQISIAGSQQPPIERLTLSLVRAATGVAAASSALSLAAFERIKDVAVS
jgi:hypothetical protein